MLTWLLKKLRFGQSEDGHGSSSQFEVERKYRLSQEEFDDLPSILRRSGYHFHREQQMTDTFIPALEQDDMIRIRDIRSQGKDSSVLTLKKWTVVEGERVRRERETESLDPVARDCLLEMGTRLATEALLSFSKKRVEYRGERDGKTVTIALTRSTDWVHIPTVPGGRGSFPTMKVRSGKHSGLCREGRLRTPGRRA
ncbi:MAG: CYTH domain-containing protein [Cyanobacteriota/Melainabacteria group bacterium]